MTREDKNAIYREWLKIFSEGIAAKHYFAHKEKICLCDCFYNLRQKFHSEIFQDEIEYYPEIYKRKPKEMYSFSIWFSLDYYGYNKRIEILEQAIKETE